jgi:hypothetical protein
MSRTWFLRYEHSSQQRLGALKVLVGLLDPQRRSSASDKVDLAIQHLLLADPYSDGKGRRLLRSKPPRRKAAGQRGRAFPGNMAERLLAEIDAPSLLFTVTEPKIARVREWGRQLGFLGNGNQITERGLLLQHFMGAKQIDAIRRGRLFEANPFRLSLPEKVYCLFVLLERDGIWPFLFKRLAKIGKNTIIKGLDADKVTCQALLDLLEVPQSGLSGGELLRRRELRRLAFFMADSLGVGLPVGTSIQGSPRSARAKRPEQRGRTRTNTADDQAIPRFENLVDLGFLDKEIPEDRDADSIQDSQRHRIEWRYAVADPLVKWVDAAGNEAPYLDEFLWTRFAGCAAAAYGLGGRTILAVDSPADALELFLEAYAAVRRPVGHTPFESVALTAMVQGLAKGLICEMASLHELFLGYKREGLFGDELKFASGNELDRMFIHIRPQFRDKARSHHGR